MLMRELVRKKRVLLRIGVGKNFIDVIERVEKGDYKHNNKML